MKLALPVSLFFAVWAQDRPPAGYTAAQIADRAVAAHGGRNALAGIEDSVFEGAVTFFTVDGASATHETTLFRKGKRQLQRIIRSADGEIRQGSDGFRSWRSAGGLSSVAAGHVLQFIESQTLRSPQRLFDHESEGVVLRDAGVDPGGNGGARVLAAEDGAGRKTRYFIDGEFRVSGLEVIADEYGRDPFTGRPVPRTDVYLFSDFRRVGGVVVPFRIERYIDGIKSEEMRFRSGRHNVSVNEAVFRP